MITGYTFDRAKVSAFQDSTLYDFLNFGQNTVIPNIGDEMAVTVNGLTCTIAPGKAVVCGRLIDIASAQDVQIPANSTGYLCLTVDLSQVNTSSGEPGQTDYTFVINQVRAEFVASLTQDNLFDGGLIYNFPLGTVTSTSVSTTFAPIPSSYAGKSPQVLYDNPSGTMGGTVTLNDNYTNYGTIGVYFRWGGAGTTTSGCQHFSTTNCTGCACTLSYPNVDANLFYIRGIVLAFSGSTVTFNRNYSMVCSSSGCSLIDEQMNVYKVIGYSDR